MGRLIAVLALAGAAAFAARPSSNAHARVAAPAPAAAAVERTADPTFAQAEKDLARRQAELGLVGAAPLFGAEGLPKPTR
jgi:methionine-rich copper-binding protein CopC